MFIKLLHVGSHCLECKRATVYNAKKTYKMVQRKMTWVQGLTHSFVFGESLRENPLSGIQWCSRVLEVATQNEP